MADHKVWHLKMYVLPHSYSDANVVFDVALMVTEKNGENLLLGEVKRNF